ncbi:zinc finger protein 84-like [Planococcus citri]|uniref:zinc finger protein 84-like n=1 Tax=Planococcus citri TaxID=170843 RepID=UPI0031F856CD
MNLLNNFSKDESARRTHNIGCCHSSSHQFINHNSRQSQDDAFPSDLRSECCGTESETEEHSKKRKDLSESAKCEAKTIELVESIGKVAEGGCSIGLSVPSLEISSHDLHRSEEPLEQFSDDGCIRHITQASLVEFIEKVTEDYRSTNSFRSPLEISSDDHHNSEEQLEQVPGEVALVETARNIATDAGNTIVAPTETSTYNHITENASNTFIILVPSAENPNNILHNSDAQPAQDFQVARSETSRNITDDIRDYLTIPFPEYSNSSLPNTATRPQKEYNQFLNLTTLSTQISNDEVRCNVEEHSQQPSEENPASEDSQSCFSDSTKANNRVLLLVLNEQFVKTHARRTLRIEQVQVTTQRPNCNDVLNMYQGNGETSSLAGCSKNRESDGEGWISRSVKKNKELPSAVTSIQTSDSVPKKVPKALTRDSPPYCCNICDRTFSYQSVWKKHQQEHLKPFLCPKCNIPFAEKQYLIEHQATHREKRPYKCRFCDARYKHSRGKLKHERHVHTNVSRFECAVCGKIFALKSSLINHLRIHSDQKLFCCQTCGASFSQKYSLVRHQQRAHNKEKNLKCRICNQLFKYQKAKAQHERVHLEGPRFKCTLCGKKYQQKQGLTHHMSKHHQDSKVMHERIHVEDPCFECALCGKKYNQKKDLTNHIFNHKESQVIHERLPVEGPRFECALCGKKYHQKQDLTNHIFNHKDSQVMHERLPAESPHFECTLCGKKYHQKQDLTNHILKQKDGKCDWTRHQRKHLKQFHCQKCGKHYAFKTHLIRHQATHCEKRTYKCDICGARFKHNNTKLRHERYMHSEVTCFECAVCGKKFNHKSSIFLHLRVHSGQKPFRCETCGKRFSCKPELVSHQWTHSKVKKFKCRICNRSFKHKHTKTTHERLHVEGARFECALCGKKYRQKIGLAYHTSKQVCSKSVEDLYFECALCGKKYSQKVGLAYHISNQVCSKSEKERSNVEGPRFECAVCGNKYREKRYLAKHLSNQVCSKSAQEHLHVKGLRFECALCGKKYRKKYGLAYHISHNCS